MKRKTFLNRLGLGAGGAILLPSVSLLQSCSYEPKIRTALTQDDVVLLDEIGETIIPTTDAAPGAKATNIGAYMLLMYEDCMPTKEQAVLLNGINELDARAVNLYSDSFLAIDAAQKLELLEMLQAEAVTHTLQNENVVDAVPHYFGILKNLTVSGYFSSE
ncbi:unnamed protein product, partial [Ectocarpus sp. 12 AP-2014]